ncbi:hypothetical protein AVEN_129891-1, partial [Araneus ventricosus]
TPNHELRVGSLAQEYGLSYLSDFNLTFWISFQHQSKNHILIGTEQGSMILFELSETDDREANTVAVSVQEHIASKAMAFSYYDEQWFAVLQSSGESTWLRFYQRVGRGLEGRQTIALDGEADFDLVTVKGVHYLAVVTYRTAVHQSMLILYHWTQTQFDKITSRSVQGARSVSCWVLDGSLYLAVAQEVNEGGNYRVGSPIFLYNAKDDDGLVLLQMLDTYGPRKVRYFFVSGSHYVIFFGQEDAAIYWWSSDQFLFWQRIEGTAFALDAAVLALANGEAMIVIALKEEAYFYAQDFSGRYIRAFSMSLPGHLASLQFMFSGKAYYALARFTVRPQSIWKLTLDTYSMPTEATFNPLHQCLLEVAGLIDERHTKIEEAHRNLGRVWLKNRNQTVTAEVIVTGQTSSSQDSAISILVVVTDRRVLPDTSMPLVENAISNMKSIVNGIQQSIRGSVLKSVEQKIIGSKHFAGAITIPSLNLESISIDVPINGIPISRIHHFALRKYGNQTFKYPLTINHISSENVWTNAFNGIPVNDLLLLGGEQTVTGILKFFDLITQDVVVGSVNSIPVESFVTTSSNQIIRDLKNITILRSQIIDVHGETNGEDLQKFSQQVVSILDDDEIIAQYTVASTLEITENFYLKGLVNSLVSLEQLATYSVLKHTEQTLKGPFVFISQLHIYENLVASGYINSIDTTQLVTLSTEQTISGDVIFEEQLTINLDLVSNNINGIDLDKTAVRKTTEPQFVVGFVTFSQRLTAAEIVMTEFVMLDSVDPSLLVQDIVKHEEGVVKGDVTVFHDVVVLGDLVVSEGVNGYKISDLPTTVWLKSRTQTVEVPIHVFKVTAEADMEATTVNTFHLDTDVAHSYKNETIMSVKTFLNEVVVPKHVNTNKVIFNGLDTVSLKDEMDHLPNDGKIYGQKSLQVLEIHGDIAAELFNDLQVNDLMHPTMPQEVEGEIEFLSETTVIKNVLFSDTVNFNTFNGNDLRMFINMAVVKAPKHAIRNKRFWTIEGQHMALSEGSTLGGISFSGMLGRIVTLNTRQEISVQKTFIDYIQLEKSSSVFHLNSKPWDGIIGNVVLLDEPGRISSQKAFTGDVKAGHVTIVELVNGVNITRMTLTAFLKSQDNAVGQQVIFLNDVTVSNLDVQTTIDGLSWNDFIYTHQDERLEAVLLLSDVVLGANMRVDGLLNECDIVKIGQKAIYANKTTQFIKERIIVQKLNIIGNLHMKEEVNHILIEDLQRQFVTISGDQIITSDVQMGSSVKVVVLNLVDLMNDVDVTSIMNDAVRHSFPQEISGLKNFEVVSADALTASELFIVESLDGLDVNGIFDNAVWKVGDQVIDGDKTFFSIKSNTAEAHGFINGLRLPDGVVLTDTSDRISGHTTFKSDITLGSDLVIHGQINGKNLLHFILDRITLSGEQVVSSQLSFAYDVLIRGNLLVDETVNDLFLDLVFRVKQGFPLEGHKTFVDFYVEGSLSAASINGYDVMKMDEGILRYNRDEILYEVQVFEKSLRAQNSLFTERINGKSLSEMVKSFLSIAGNYNRSLNYFDDLSYSLIRHITGQLQASADRITRFAYFVLVQDIDLGPATKILYGHDFGYAAGEFSHSMVIWTSEKHCAYMERCCHQEFSYWMRVKKSGHLMIDGTPETGRYYPIQNPAPITVDKDFVFWTDSAALQSKWCNSSTSGQLLLSSLKASGGKVFLRIKSAPSLSEAKSFWRGQRLYAVAGYYFDRKEDEYSSAVVYVFNEVRREWRERQHLPSYGVLSLDITHNKMEDEILLAIGTGMGTYSSIYVWNDAGNEFELLQNIPPKYVTSTLWLKHGSIQLLAMSSVDHWPKKGEDCFVFLSGGQVDIYVYEGRAKWIQSIPLRGVVSMISLTLSGDTFLIAASHQLQSIFIYEWKGYAGFSLIQTVFVGEVRHLNTYTVDDGIYVTVAVTNGPSKLLKVVSQGKHALAVPIRREIVPRELKDEGIEDKLVPGC